MGVYCTIIAQCDACPPTPFLVRWTFLVNAYNHPKATALAREHMLVVVLMMVMVVVVVTPGHGLQEHRSRWRMCHQYKRRL